MNNIEKLEAVYKKFIHNLPDWLPEGIIRVDLALLQEMDLLDFDKEIQKPDDSLTRYFQVIEQEDKITLVNEEYVIWIVPSSHEEIAATYTLVALNKPGHEPELELAFSVSGVYNTSKMVLRLLEKFLAEIHENEEALKRLDKGLDSPEEAA